MKITLVLAAFALVALCLYLYCKSPKVETAEDDDDAVSTAVYRELEGRIHYYNSLTVWLSHDYDPSYWNPKFDEAQSEIDAVKNWARALPRGKVRTQYLEWINYYYQVGIDEARSELETHKEEKEMEEYNRDGRRSSARASELLGKITTPPK